MSPLTNLPWPPVFAGPGAEAWANASAHVAWACALPLAGYAADGKRGALIAGASWVAVTLALEWPTHRGADPSEIRTDLITRIVPTLVVNALLFFFAR